MEQKIKTLLIIILSLFLVNPLFSSNLVKKISKHSEDNITSDKSSKYKYSVEETTEILRSSQLGNIKLDRDDHIYKCLKIAQKAKNLEGAAEVLISSNVKLGRTLDYEEVDLLIKISKIDTDLYNEIILAAKKIGKKKTNIKEHFNISNELEKGNGKYILAGIERAIDCNYRIDRDYLSWEVLNLLIQIGRLTNEDRIFDIYNAMRSLGINGKIDSKGLEVLYKLYYVEGDVASKITKYLKPNNSKSRKHLNKQDYILISGFIFYSSSQQLTSN